MSLLQYLRDSPHETKNSIEIQNTRNMMDCLDQSIIKMSQDNIDFLTKNKKGKKKIAENNPLVGSEDKSLRVFSMKELIWLWNSIKNSVEP